jgi:hypothetical protein
MFTWIALATAEDMTWTCPVLDSPGDAEGFRDVGELGTADLLDELLAVAEADEACPDPTCVWDDGYCAIDCETAAGIHVEGTVTFWSAFDYTDHTREYTLTPSAESGLSWSSLRLLVEFEQTGFDSAWTWEATWVGELDPRWPADASVVARVSEFSEAWEDGTCTWSVSQSSWPSYDIRVGAQRLALRFQHCDDIYTADLDGSLSAVSTLDWSEALTDDDHDGLPAGACDCDDTRADVNSELDEPHATDDLDTNCDGLAQPDEDFDGYGSAEFGGDDCDDDDSDVHPGAEEVGWNRIDEDCDGYALDDIDQDGDPAELYGGGDCDDEDPARSSLQDEVPGNGVDEDCDGFDPNAPATAVWGVGTAPAEPDDPGCGRGCAALVFLPLLGRRRR